MFIACVPNQRFFAPLSSPQRSVPPTPGRHNRSRSAPRLPAASFPASLYVPERSGCVVAADQPPTPSRRASEPLASAAQAVVAVCEPVLLASSAPAGNAPLDVAEYVPAGHG